MDSSREIRRVGPFWERMRMKMMRRREWDMPRMGSVMISDRKH
jgi:hypothetical protein